MRIIYIYCLIDPNGKKYIGQTYNIIDRLKRHLRADSAIGCALYEFEPINFKIKILHKTYDRKTANELEIVEIEQQNSLCPNGYNIAKGGYSIVSSSGMTGKHHSIEVRKIMREKRLGLYAGNKNPAKKPGVGEKISKAKQGKKRPDVSERNKGNKYGQGRIYKPSKKSGIKRSITCLKKAIAKLEKELAKEK